jgi:DNA-directed RNA polymerase specialized sigma24 family protein
MTGAVVEFAMNHYPASVAFARRRGIPGHLAEDMVGDAVLRLLLIHDREIQYPPAYWWSTLRNVCRSYFRRCREAPIGEHATSFLDCDRVYWRSLQRPSDEDPEAAAIGIEGEAAVQKILEGLTVKEREALSLRLEGEQQPGVNGRVNLFRARRKLRQSLESVGA